MAGSIQLKKGTKMQLAFDVPVGQEPQFNMLCTFNKALDESAFLVSAPMVDGKRLVPDESQKLLFKYTEGEESNILAGYVDDVVKEGIRHYLKVRRVAEQRQFIKRMDVRMKVELPITYMQDTWELNSEGEVDKEKGQTMDISNNGLAVYMNRWFEVGESCIFTLPRLGTAACQRSRGSHLLDEGNAERQPVPLRSRYPVKICRPAGMSGYAGLRGIRKEKV